MKKKQMNPVKTYSLKQFYEKALGILTETGYAIKNENLKVYFSLEGKSTRCHITYEEGLLNVFAAGDTPDIAIHDLSHQILKKNKPKVDPILTI